jgi:hypothetical protein
MATVRGLLTLGNSKLGEGIHVWSLPAGKTCPASTETCRKVCYATKARFLLPAVVDRLDRNYRESLKPSFADRLADEVREKGCQVVRIHVSGDWYSAEYAEKWLWVMRHRPKPRYYFYTRSHAVPEILPVLEQMAALTCCRVWFSVDRDLCVDRIPPGVRIAYLQADADEEPELLDLRFVVRRLRKPKLSLPMLCPNENGSAANCGDCGRCYR